MQNDTELKQNVQAELTWEPSVTEAHIGVTARDGVVTLMGHVGSYMEKYAAERAAYRVKGVKAVAEELAVQLPVHSKRTDEDIASIIVDRLKWNAAVPADTIHVKVENGWVTLSGKVEWHFQRDAATQDVRTLIGVVGVTDELAIMPRVNTKTMKDDIMHALHRSWFSPDQITVKANEGAVTLSGNVKSWPDFDLATSTAWSAPGTVSVHNAISVA